VSLEGTLETIALPDVLALLSVTAKTGELRIEASGGMGSVWFDAGGIAGFDVGSHRTAVDALFALLRLKEGSFKFHTGTRPVNAIPPQDVNPLLEEAEDRLSQWPGIASAVPSLDCELSLEEAVDGTVMLRPDQWSLVAAIAGGRTVAEVLEARGLSEFDGCRALKELVDLRLVRVAAPAAASVPEPVPDVPAEVAADGTLDFGLEMVPAEAHADRTPDLADEPMEPEGWPGPEGPDVADLSEIWDDEAGDVVRGVADAEGVVPAPGADEEPGPDVVVADPVNRGLLLKFLGSARN
jgi:hypothetical protein